MENEQAAPEQAQVEASLDAGFNKTREEITPVETLRQERAEPAGNEASTEVQLTASEPAQAVEEPMIGGFKESEFKALLAKAQRVEELESQIKGNHDKAFGKFGELQRTINELKERPAGAPTKVTGAALKRLTENFPELAEMLAEDLSELSIGSSTNNADSAAIEARFDQRLEEINRANEQKLLAMKHRDWRTTVKSDDFVLWKNTLPAEHRTELDNSWDALYISENLDAFKEWKSKAPKQKTDKRIEAALTPNGTPVTAPGVLPDNAGLNAGFNKVRR